MDRLISFNRSEPKVIADERELERTKKEVSAPYLKLSVPQAVPEFSETMESPPDGELLFQSTDGFTQVFVRKDDIVLNGKFISRLWSITVIEKAADGTGSTFETERFKSKPDATLYIDQIKFVDVDKDGVRDLVAMLSDGTAVYFGGTIIE